MSQGILRNGINEQNKYWVGSDLVRSAMTLQRYNDSRDGGLTLLEALLGRGLDDAWRFLKHADSTSDVSDWSPLESPGRRRRLRPRS